MLTLLRSLMAPSLPTSAYWTSHPTTPRFYSNWVGSTTNKAQHMIPRNVVSSTWRNLSPQTTKMRKAGISWVVAICRSKSTPRHMKHINKPYTVMERTPRSGARLACCTIRSTNTEMRWTRTHGLFVSTRTFLRSGMTSALL